MSGTSKTVLYCEKSLRQVETGDTEHRSKLAMLLDEKYGPGAGEATDVLLGQHRDYARTRFDRLSAAERESVRQSGDVIGPRDRRNDLTATASATLVKIRGVGEHVGGRAVTEGMGFSGTTPRDENGVLQVGEHVLDAYDKRGQPAAFAATGVDLGILIEKLRGEITELRGLVDEVAREDREAQSATIAKNAALADFDDGFAAYAGLLTRLLRNAGMNAEADRLRPSRSRPGRTETVAAEEDADAAAATDPTPAQDAV